MQVSIGRSCVEFDVDIDLSMEGPALKISRRQVSYSSSPIINLILYNPKVEGRVFVVILFLFSLGK